MIKKKICDLDPMEVFTRPNWGKCIHLNVDYYMNFGESVVSKYHCDRNLEVEVLGKVEFRAYPKPEEQESMLDEWARHSLR
jgi:hypothetical protein